MAFDFEHTGTGIVLGRFEEIYAYISNFLSTSQLKHNEIISAFGFPPPHTRLSEKLNFPKLSQLHLK